MANVNYYMKKKNSNILKEYHNKKMSSKEIGVLEIENGVIIPAKKDNSDKKLWALGGVLDKDLNFVDESSTRYLFGGEYEVYEDDIHYIDEEVIYMGPFIKHWGHFICDEITRLWYAKSDKKKHLIAYCGWNFNNPKDTSIDGNYLEVLECLGINKNQLVNILRPTRFKKVIIPDFSMIVGQYISEEFYDMLNTIKNEALNKLKNKKLDFENIYLARTNIGKGKEKNEEALIKLFEKNNYKVLIPENLSFLEQVYYFNKCKNIAMLSGSIAHNLMFSSSDLNAIIINKFGGVNDYQCMIDNFIECNINYIDCYKSYKKVLFGAGPFLLYNSKYLGNFFKENNYNYDKSIGKIHLEDVKWYFKNYHVIYSDKLYKKLLRNK